MKKSGVVPFNLGLPPINPPNLMICLNKQPIIPKPDMGGINPRRLIIALGLQHQNSCAGELCPSTRDASVQALSNIMVELGIAIDGGKDG